MKNSRVKMWIVAIMVITGLVSCNTKQKPTEDYSEHDHEMMEDAHEDDMHGMTEKGNPGTLQTQQLSPMMISYMKIKDALVADDADGAGQVAKQMMEMDVVEEMHGSLNTIANTDNLNSQREAFGSLSNSMYEMAKSGKMKNTLYWNHCPMAMNNRGANWLSLNEEIRNPYMGQRMLKCGRVEEKL